MEGKKVLVTFKSKKRLKMMQFQVLIKGCFEKSLTNQAYNIWLFISVKNSMFKGKQNVCFVL